uniref:Succinyl-CoA ligase [ADP-forming] subunit alpha-1, mitochondrial n=1 Tax=Anthurium amnicola TaxID=1678845 RepID=A0A1D1XCP2_9ARAE
MIDRGQSGISRDRLGSGIILIGEIGGTVEDDAAALVKDALLFSHLWTLTCTANEPESGTQKPIVAFVAGLPAPPGHRMGHVGAIISGGKGTVQDKIKMLRAAGVTVAESPAKIGMAMLEVFQQCGLVD